MRATFGHVRDIIASWVWRQRIDRVAFVCCCLSVTSDARDSAWRFARKRSHQRFIENLPEEKGGDEGQRKVGHSSADCLRGESVPRTFDVFASIELIRLAQDTPLAISDDCVGDGQVVSLAPRRVTATWEGGGEELTPAVHVPYFALTFSTDTNGMVDRRTRVPYLVLI